MNLITHNIQVIDNGKGISKHNFELIGQRYATSKYLSTKELKDNPYIFGQRGEALASIIKISKIVKITSKTADSSETYMKTFENGKSLGVSDTSDRASKGTTILIEDFMYNLPVRKSHMKINNCIEEIKNEIEAIALIHSDISFSVRHDPPGEIIFQTYKTKYMYETTTHLYGNEFTKQLRKIHFANDKLKISGMISVVGHGHKRIQLVYVNKRHLKKSKIHSLVNSLIRKSKILKNNSSPTLKHKYGVYIINLNCSRSEYDVVDFNNILIEFRNWDDILACVEQAMKEFLEKENLLEKPKEITTNDFQTGTYALQEPIQVRTSQYDGVIRGVSVKRKQSEPEDKIESKLSVIIIEDNDNKIREKTDNERIPKEKKPRITTEETKEKLSGAENSVNKNDKNDNEKQLQVAMQKSTKKIVKEIIAKAQEQKKMKYYNSLKVETHSNTKEKHSDNDIRVLRSLADAQDIILNMFLKSTAVFKTDEDLKEEFTTKNKENVDEIVDGIVNIDKQRDNGYISNSAKPQNNISNLNDQGNSEQIFEKQVTTLDKDNSKLLDKKAISSFNDEVNVISHLNPINQINFRQISKHQTTNLVKQDNFAQISKNQIKNANPAKPIQVSKAIQVSASKIPELNWNPDVRKIDPFQLFNKRKSPSKFPVTLNTKINPNSNLHLNPKAVNHENLRKQCKVSRNQHSNMKQKLEKRRINNEVLKKPGLTKGNDNFKLNFNVKKVTYKDIFKNNQKHFTRKPLRQKNYVQASYGNYKRIEHGAEGHKIPIVTRFNYRLISSSSSTFAHRDLTSLKYNYKYTVRKTQKFIHSSNFIKPAINDKEKCFKLKSSLNPREILHAKSMIKTWYDFNKNSNQCRQNFRDTKFLFGKTFCTRKNQVLGTKKLRYTKPIFTNEDYTDLPIEDNNYRINLLKPINGLRMKSFKPMNGNNFDPYFNVQKEICSFENNNKQNKVDNILKPNHFDFQNCFKKPKSPKSKYIPCRKNVPEPNILYKKNEVDKILEPNQFDFQTGFKNPKSPKPKYMPCSKNEDSSNALYNNMTISQSFDITFPTILPENEDVRSVCDNQKYMPEIIEILAPRNCETISQINEEDWNSNFQYPYTKQTDYLQYNNLAKQPMSVCNKEKQNYQNIRPHSFENNYPLEELNFRDIPQASEDAYVPFSTNPHLNEYIAEKANHVSSYIPPQDYTNLNKYSDENKQCIPAYLQLQDNEILNRFLSEIKQNNTSNIQPQKLEHFNKSSSEKTKQLKSYVQAEYYEKPLNMQQRKRTLLDESLIYPYVSPNIHLENRDVQFQGHEKCLNTPAGNTESFNITFSPKSCVLMDVSKDIISYNSHELSKIQTRKSNYKEIVAETPVSKMGDYVFSYNNSSSKNEDISNSPSGNNLPSCRSIENLALCIASNNNNEQNINYPNMDVSTRKLSQNVSQRNNYNARQDLNNISCSKDVSKHVSPAVIEMHSSNFNGNQLNFNTKNSEHVIIVSKIKETINNNHNSNIDSHSVVDLTSCVNEAGPDKVKNCNIDSNGGHDLNKIDVLSNSRRSPERQPYIISGTTINRLSGTSKTIISTHSNKNLNSIDVLSNIRRSPERPHIVISDTTVNKHFGTCKNISSTHSNKKLELNTSKFGTQNLEISTVNQKNNTDIAKSKSAVEKILNDFESLCNSDSDKNVENQFPNSGINNTEVTKKHIDIAKNTSMAESVFMDLQNIMNSGDSEINLNIRTTIPEKNNSQISTEYLKFSYDPADIAKNNMDAENDPDDFDITFDFDPDFLRGSKHSAFEENTLCEFSINTEDFLNNIDSKKEEKMSNKTVKVFNCEYKSNISNLSSFVTNTVSDSNENKIEIGKSFNTETINNINYINNANNETLKLECVKNSTTDDKALLPMTTNPNYETPNNTRSFPRPSFLPKGMSPILYSVSTAPINELSPTSKKKLHQIMAKSKHDDLQTVKWMNYFQTKG